MFITIVIDRQDKTRQDKPKQNKTNTNTQIHKYTNIISVLI